MWAVASAAHMVIVKIKSVKAKPSKIKTRVLPTQPVKSLSNMAKLPCPWDERLCVVPEADLFKAINKGKASVVTGQIDTFTKEGILLQNGEVLKADIIITATGLELQMIGGVKIFIDGIEPNPNDAIVYKGMMIKDVPNFVFVVGYTNASWTLKADLGSSYFCRLIYETEKQH